MTSLVVSGLVKGFGAKPVLTGVDLRVEAGTITAILGPSGSGKTTLLRVVCGFERAQAGSVELDDEIVDDATHFVAPERRRIGYVPQEGNLFPHLTRRRPTSGSACPAAPSPSSGSPICSR